ncbi:uncharacterized protein I206_105048 [Kwoniella pini CBS 10737]|uniref:Uncharacterized protein n=1 Tax=Kwoniella pini CBS 10737 TaxID=1296096 RepID=A0A1B9I8F6_9TREE|nr:uncharacterized protein I206_02588 [Kwoniella pini CBS 10737]OCF51872.1 hypothetical protein I206_02588 [Kwoniella pini CBS 10737]
MTNNNTPRLLPQLQPGRQNLKRKREASPCHFGVPRPSRGPEKDNSSISPYHHHSTQIPSVLEDPSASIPHLDKGKKRKSQSKGWSEGEKKERSNRRRGECRYRRTVEKPRPPPSWLIASSPTYHPALPTLPIPSTSFGIYRRPTSHSETSQTTVQLPLLSTNPHTSSTTYMDLSPEARAYSTIDPCQIATAPLSQAALSQQASLSPSDLLHPSSLVGKPYLSDQYQIDPISQGPWAHCPSLTPSLGWNKGKGSIDDNTFLGIAVTDPRPPMLQPISLRNVIPVISPHPHPSTQVQSRLADITNTAIYGNWLENPYS